MALRWDFHYTYFPLVEVHYTMDCLLQNISTMYLQGLVVGAYMPATTFSFKRHGLSVIITMYILTMTSTPSVPNFSLFWHF